ncbi:amidase family protein [Actinomadura sp. DC4]|uniref:amidase n=1 Tax=Actinomadura sp. DC4 TaxID=3055069 RepID=UPI0025B2232D|nr:amidase family protein [Actinomadura sp. DC4]MDN3355600.1 amidase family protein [Actinomadura sp. DC4]
MDLHEYASHDAVGLRDLIRAGEVTAAEVETAARRALEAVNAHVNGLALPLFEPALDHAPDGPFAGVPFLIKDSGPMAEGVPFFIGSRAVQNAVSPFDTDLMTRFRAAGLVTLGLTTVPELVISFSTESLRYGPTRNPWDLTRGVGGSSGGAAALVAAGAVPLAHGNDGAGSVRVPASCCGLVGLKPSRGRTPCGPGTGEPAFGMAYESGLTRTVRDTAHYLDAIQGPGVGDKYTAPPPGRPYAEEPGADPGRLRVAVTTRAWSGADVDPEVAEATVRAGRLLEEMGHDVAEASPRVDWDAVMHAATAELAAIVAPVLMAPRRPDPARMEAVSRQAMRMTEELGALELIAGLEAQNRVTRAVGAFFTEYDLLVTPTLGRPPAPHGTLRYDDPDHTVESWLTELFDYGPFTVLFNISGQPALSLPLGQASGGLPVGVQFVAPYGREDLLLRIAARLEEAAPWRDRRPSVFAAPSLGGAAER